MNMPMEAISIVLQFISIFWAPIVEFWKCHRRVTRDIEDLKNKMEELECQKDDMEITVTAELRRGKTKKKEYDNWVAHVEKISSEVEELNGEIGRVKYLDRARLDKRVSQKLKEVGELYQKGNSFSSLVVDAPTAEVVAEGIPAPYVMKEEIVPCSPNDYARSISAGDYGGAVMDHERPRHVNYPIEAMQQTEWRKKRYRIGALVGGLIMQGGHKIVEKYQEKNKKVEVPKHKIKKAKTVR